MGAAADAAKKNSNFLKLEKGESIVVKFHSYRIVPSNLDPTKDVIQCRFITPHGDKYWTNSNSKIMLLFDTMAQNTTIRLTRGAWMNKDGTEDKSKSSYVVDVLEKGDPESW